MAVLFPHLSELRIESVVEAGAVVRIEASAPEAPVPCPDCGQVSSPVHSRYERRLFCSNSACDRRTFAEQLPGLAGLARRTTLLERVLGAVGRAGSGWAAPGLG
ncbi:hypothetical protein IU433_21810 [Nocardia puris]|uniref:hypothetical protein n=1 Tax=Nocardia TaxID=1817 RepID=UPI00068D1A8F|nr:MULTISPECIES: hypothetical protein [Nocardia]MBF6137160.1 hypothetical protein [Nocardia otitidiscaviarum]MBF6181764.1 hypothetical protein [Nocardia otitidiscaviarum]MBF6461657.1 hypothetical protein [Nocardia puris]MBF6488059.1 hypothetical protein [Nocardia otitidiscaviarum]